MTYTMMFPSNARDVLAEASGSRAAWLCLLLWRGPLPSSLAQSKSPLPTSPGQERCSMRTVHRAMPVPPVAARAPDLKSLMELTPETVLAAMTTGPMTVPAQKLGDAEKREIAEYLGGRPLDDKHTGDAPNRWPATARPIPPLAIPPTARRGTAGAPATETRALQLQRKQD